MSKLERIAQTCVEAAYPYHPTKENILAALRELRERLAKECAKHVSTPGRELSDTIRRWGEDDE